MLDVLERCFPDRIGGWKAPLKAMIPNYGSPLSASPESVDAVTAETARALQIS
jgi:malate dehydrogenase (quinone)